MKTTTTKSTSKPANLERLRRAAATELLERIRYAVERMERGGPLPADVSDELGRGVHVDRYQAACRPSTAPNRAPGRPPRRARSRRRRAPRVARSASTIERSVDPPPAPRPAEIAAAVFDQIAPAIEAADASAVVIALLTRDGELVGRVASRAELEGRTDMPGLGRAIASIDRQIADVGAPLERVVGAVVIVGDQVHPLVMSRGGWGAPGLPVWVREGVAW